ncbi:histone-lysine N-methyltransferase SUV39H [Cryptococcus gattii Ru294]|nr:histone-lysine N-methyltransferase SUV39H [Cryptococcus gattii Ru294]
MSIADSCSSPEDQNINNLLGNHSQTIGVLPSPPLVEDRAAPNGMEVNGEDAVGQGNETNAVQPAVHISGTPLSTSNSNRPQLVSGAQPAVASSSRSPINSPPKRTPSIPQRSPSSHAASCRSINNESPPSRPPTPPLPPTHSTPVILSGFSASSTLSLVPAASSNISPTISSGPPEAPLSDPNIPTVLPTTSITAALSNPSTPSTSTTPQASGAVLTSSASFAVVPISVAPATSSSANPGLSTLQRASEATKSCNQKEASRKTKSKQSPSPSSTHGSWTHPRPFNAPSNLSATSREASAASSRSTSRAPLPNRPALSDTVADPTETTSVLSTGTSARTPFSSLPSQSQGQGHPRSPSLDGVGNTEREKFKTLSSGTGQIASPRLSSLTSDVPSDRKTKSTGLHALPPKPSNIPTSSIPQRTSTLATAMSINPFVRLPTPPPRPSSSEASRPPIQTSKGAIKTTQNQDKIHPLSTASSIPSPPRQTTTEAATPFRITISSPSPSQSTSASTKSHVAQNAQSSATSALSDEKIHPFRRKSKASESVPATSQAIASLSYRARASGGAREGDKKTAETSVYAGPSSADSRASTAPSTSAIAPTVVTLSKALLEDAPILKSGSIVHPLFHTVSANGGQDASSLKMGAVGDVWSQGSKGRASSPQITTTGAVSHFVPPVDVDSKTGPVAVPLLSASDAATKNVDAQAAAQPPSQVPLPSAISALSKKNLESLSKESSIKSSPSSVSSSSTVGDSASGLRRKPHHKSTQSEPQGPLPTTNTNNNSGIEVNSWLNPQPFGSSFAASHLSTHAKKKIKEREREKKRKREKVKEEQKAKDENEQLRQKRMADLEKLSANLERYKEHMAVKCQTRSILREDGESRKRPPGPETNVGTGGEMRTVKRSKPTWAVAPEDRPVVAETEKENGKVNKKTTVAIEINNQLPAPHTPTFATSLSSVKATATPLAVTVGLGPPVNSCSSSNTPSLLNRSINLDIPREKPKERMDDDDGDDSAGGLPVRKTGQNGAVEEQVEQVRLDLDDVSIHSSSPVVPLSTFTSQFKNVSITPSQCQKVVKESDDDVPIQHSAGKVNGKQKTQSSEWESDRREGEDDILNWPSRKGKGRAVPEPQDRSETQRDDDDHHHHLNLGPGSGEEESSDEDSIPAIPPSLFEHRPAHVRQPLQTLSKGGLVAKHSYQRPLAKSSAVSPVPSADRTSSEPSAKVDLLPQKRKRRLKKLTREQWHHIAQNSLSDVDDLLDEPLKKPKSAEELGADLSKLTKPRIFPMVSHSESRSKRASAEEDNEYFTDSDSHTSDVALFVQYPDPPPPPERIREAKREFNTRTIDPWNRQKHTFRSNPALHRAIFEAYIMQSTSMEESGGDDIKVTNDVDAAGGPPDFEFVYSDTMLYPDGIPPPELSLGCDCDGPCDPDSKTCTCVKRQELYFYDLGLKGFAYDENGKVRENSASIWECNELCGCPPECMNRVIQRGRARDTGIEIFKTKEKGWGIRARSFIPSGTYIGSYTGELIREAESERRGVTYAAIGRTYVFDLDGWQIRHPPEGLEKIDKRAAELAEAVKMRAKAAMRESQEDAYNAYSVDAFHYGNHSCDPNLAITQAYVKDFHPERPLLVIFTRRDIKKHEELCISYKGIPDDGDIPSPEPVKKKKGGKDKKQISKTSASAHPPEMIASDSGKGLVEVKDICRW